MSSHQMAPLSAEAHEAVDATAHALLSAVVSRRGVRSSLIADVLIKAADDETLAQWFAHFAHFGPRSTPVARRGAAAGFLDALCARVVVSIQEQAL